jgi:hypothetical protein
MLLVMSSGMPLAARWPCGGGFRGDMVRGKRGEGGDLRMPLLLV